MARRFLLREGGLTGPVLPGYKGFGIDNNGFLTIISNDGTFSTILLSSESSTNNGVLTLNGTEQNATVESNLTFDGNTLSLQGNLRLNVDTSWNVQLKTRKDISWLDITDSLDTVYHRWFEDRYYVGNSTTYLQKGSGGNNIVIMNGNLGIGIQSPSFAIDALGTIRAGLSSGKISISNDNINGNITNSSGSFLFFTPNSTNYIWHINNVEQMRLNQLGNLGIGINNPVEKIEVNGKSKASEFIATNGAFRSSTRPDFLLLFQSDRNLVLYDNGAPIWSSGTGISDIRTKTDIRDLESVLSDINQLSVIKFKYKPELDLGDDDHIGLIAQEVVEKFPSVVYYDENSDRYLLNYEKLTPILLKCIKEQQEEITELKTKVQTLESDIQLIKTHLGL